MSIVKTDVPMTSALSNQFMDQLLEAYPFIRGETLTETAFGRPVRALIIGDGPRQVLFTAAHHANEWLTATVLLKFAEDLAEAIQNEGILYGQRAKEMAEAVFQLIDDNTLTVNVTRLRKKLSEAGLEGCIDTKKGLGYILND